MRKRWFKRTRAKKKERNIIWIRFVKFRYILLCVSWKWSRDNDNAFSCKTAENRKKFYGVKSQMFPAISYSDKQFYGPFPRRFRHLLQMQSMEKPKTNKGLFLVFPVIENVRSKECPSISLYWLPLSSAVNRISLCFPSTVIVAEDPRLPRSDDLLFLIFSTISDVWKSSFDSHSMPFSPYSCPIIGSRGPFS